MSTFLLGNNIVIMEGSSSYGGGTMIGAMKSCELTVRTETMETCSSTSSEWRTFTTGRKEWSMSSNHLVTTVYSPLIKVGTSVVIQFKDRNNSRDYVYGTAICTEANVTGTRGNLATGSFKFKGTGALTSYLT